MPQRIEQLITHANNLVHFHFGHAVDSCIIAKRFSTVDAKDPRWQLRVRYAIGSVIHSYAGLEGIANLMRFELFERPDGPHFCNLESEPADVQEMIKKEWRTRVEIENKLTFLLERKNQQLLPGLRERVIDVRKLRNLLAHGWITSTLTELERQDDGFIGISYSVSEYKSQFGTLKFSRPDELTFGDAQMALHAVLEAARQLVQAYGRVFMVPMFEVEVTETIGAGELRDSVGHIRELIDGSPDHPTTE